MASSSLRPPSSDGIAPVNWFRAKLRCSSADNLPSSAGMRPLSPFLGRSIRVTRCARRWTVTPSHWLMDVSVFHLRSAVPRRASLAASSALQSARRPALAELGTAAVPEHGDPWAAIGAPMTSAAATAASAPSAMRILLVMPVRCRPSEPTPRLLRLAIRVNEGEAVHQRVVAVVGGQRTTKH